MPISLILFIVIQLMALVFFVETLRRTYHRFHEFPMQDERHTLPFGVVRLRHVVILYLLSYLFWGALSLWLYLTLIEPGSVPPSAPASPDAPASFFHY